MNTSKPYMLFKSVSTAAKRNSNPAAFQDWITEVQNQVNSNGKFTKFAAGYLPVSPPPFFWEYACARCLAYGLNNSLPARTCKWVNGDISPKGFCVLWVPNVGYEPFTWPKDLIEGNW